MSKTMLDTVAAEKIMGKPRDDVKKQLDEMQENPNIACWKYDHQKSECNWRKEYGVDNQACWTHLRHER